MLPASCNLWEDFPNWLRPVLITSSSVFAEIVSFPFETLKFRMQSTQNYIAKGIFGYHEMKYNYMNISHQNGYFGFFQGLRAGIDRQIFYSLARFYTYHYALISTGSREKFSWGRIIPATIVAASAAAVIGQTSNVLKYFTALGELSRSNMTMLSGRERMRKLIQLHRTPRILMAGITPCLLYENALALSEVITFFSVKRRTSHTLKNPYFSNVFAITCATALSTLVAAPFDFLQTRIILRCLERKTHKTDVIPVFKEITGKEGITSIFKGALPLFMRNWVFNTISMLILTKLINNEKKLKSYLDVMLEEAENSQEDNHR